MCGIWGIIGDTCSASFEQSLPIKARGPDRSWFVQTNNVMLAFHRLAINGLSIFGDQPFVNEANGATYYCLCNGEIYNYRMLANEIRMPFDDNTSDCSVILPLFLKLDCDVVELNRRLHGEYAFCIIECKDNKIRAFLGTDPLSVRPLFIAHNEKRFAFSSLLAGLHGYDNVQRVDQGSYMVVEVFDGNCTITNQGKYHVPKTPKDVGLVNCLQRCVERRLMSDVPIGCLLSGGLDSSLVAALAAKSLRHHKGKRLKTFAIGMHEGTDIEYGKMVAAHIDSDHTVIHFTAEEGLAALDDVIRATETYDITTIRASVGQYLIAKYIRENTDVKVVLNGDGADECQEGYLYFYLAPSPYEAHKDSMRLIDEIHLYDGLRVDRCISHFGLEARVPFLDVEFVDLYRTMDPVVKKPNKERMEKWIIRKAFEPTGLLPKEVLWRRKEAFSDGVSSKEKSWFTIIQERMEQLVSNEEFQNNKYSHNPPHTKEAYYYRKRFEEMFGGQNAHVIPHFWMPKWSKTTDPSARTLENVQAHSD